jgi:DNA helicase-2/ATP-dependent DNA helicase PcrA
MSKLKLEAELNGPQLQAVTAIEGPVLIIAGAGSGKTRVITFRIAHMLERGIPQHSILALTFTNKAAREMENRVRELTGKKLRSLTINTFHAFGVKILREEIETLGYRRNFSIYDETDRNDLIKESLRECRLSAEGVDIYKLGQLFSNIKIGRLRWGSSGGAGQADDVWEPVYREYQQSLRIFNALDFDDLLTLPLKLFGDFPEILAKYRNLYRYIMVDEFQDTSLIQYRLLRVLAGGEAPSVPETAGSGANVCVVGDDDQSIYSWRGASYENIALFEKDFPGVLEIKLEQNYRSTTTILEAANGVISNNLNRKEKRLWSGNGGGRPIELFYPADESEEADFIARGIKKLRYEEQLRYDDFGVLLRTNSLTAGIEEAFLAENIPYRVSGGQSFFQRKEIKDIISYLRVVANPDDDVNLLRIINTPRRGIGKNTIAALAELARKNHSSLWDALDRMRHVRKGGQENLFNDPSMDRSAGELDSFIEMIEKLREDILGRKELSRRVSSLVDAIDYWSYLVSEYSKNEKIARWKFANIGYLIKTIENWEQDPDNLDPTLYPWLNRISLITRDDGEDEAGKGKVNLMTIHASKGLEFPVVFIAGAEDGIIPHSRSLEDAEEEDPLGPVEEERRLFYVAITRARDKLYITSCRKRRRRQDTVDCEPSPFLDEIPQHLVEYHEPGKETDAPSTEEFLALMKERFK